MERRTGMTLAGLAAVMLAGWTTAMLPKHLAAQPPAQAGQQPGQQSVPDAPKPQTLPKLNTVVPTAANVPDAPSPTPAATSQVPSTPTPAAGKTSTPAASTEDQDVVLPPTGKGAYDIPTIVTNVTMIEVPFLVKDSRGQMVPGIQPREVQILENNVPQNIRYWTVDPFPLSVALVVDQSVTFDRMQAVNAAMGALQAAFTPYDEIALFTYNNGVTLQDPKNVFNGATSARLGALLEQSKGKGREPQMNMGGPLEQTTLINNQYADPNTTPNHRSTSTAVYAEKEFHTLNDAILAAAVQVSKQGRSPAPGQAHRRRIVYVVSDGKEYGSKAKEKDVIKFCQTNNIQVYATLIGDSSLPVIGFLDRIHLPMTMRDNALPRYTSATGGQLDAEMRETGIERSFAKIAEEARAQYFATFYSRLPPYGDKFRTLDVRVLRPSLNVVAPEGYYPNPSMTHPGVPVQQTPTTPASTTPAPKQ